MCRGAFQNRRDFPHSRDTEIKADRLLPGSLPKHCAAALAKAFHDASHKKATTLAMPRAGLTAWLLRIQPDPFNTTRSASP